VKSGSLLLTERKIRRLKIVNFLGYRESLARRACAVIAQCRVELHVRVIQKIWGANKWEQAGP